MYDSFLSTVSNIVSDVNNYMYSYILIIVLLGAGIYYTIKTKGIQFRFKDIMSAVTEKNTNSFKPNSISSFEAFAVSTASRVGTGNLAGVAFAISAGGPGALFWMWITALLGGALAFVESTLAQVYKVSNPNDTSSHFRGGPAFYIKKGLSLNWLSISFAIILIFVFGLSFNAVQANTISNAFQNSFQLPKQVTGLILASITALFVFKGLRSIAKTSSFLVPIMSLFYLALCLFIVIKNISALPSVFSMIISNAFDFQSGISGVTGGVIAIGIKRGLFSNEAGMGSAPNAAATADTTHPVKQGLIQAFGVFFDTLIICSATGFLILFSGIDFQNTDINGITLTQNALSSVFGEFGGIFLAICILLLAFSSILGNYFYAESSVNLLSSNKTLDFVFKLFVILAVYGGSVASFDLVWNIADMLMGVMTLINLYAIARLSSVLKIVLDDYNAQVKENKDPVFKKKNLDSSLQDQLQNVEHW